MSLDTAIKILDTIKKSTLAKEYNTHYLQMVGDHLNIPIDEMKKYTFSKLVEIIATGVQTQSVSSNSEKKSFKIYVPVKRLVRKISIPVQVIDEESEDDDESDDDESDSDSEDDTCEQPNGKCTESAESTEEWVDDNDVDDVEDENDVSDADSDN